MKIASLRISGLIFATSLLTFSLGVSAPDSNVSGSAPQRVRLRGHVPGKAVAASRLMGRLPSNSDVSLVFALPLRNQEELKTLLDRLYDPTDALYGHYLTQQEFADSFGPSQADYDILAGYAGSLGLRVTGTHSNRLLLNVSGPAPAVEAAFNLNIYRYEAPDGRQFYAPDGDPEVPDLVASRIVGLIGLDNASVRHPHSKYFSATEKSLASPNQIGTGPGGALTPGDIIKAYNLDGVAANGAGQALGLFELDGYLVSDVTGYINYYGLPAVSLLNVLVDGFSGLPGSGSAEVTLDIELQIAMAPGASQIIVYEGPNSDTGVVNTYNRIATDNLARQISTSWGLSEDQSGPAVINTENAIFQQMAAQGQSIYAASGDNGAYDNGFSLGVDDPASQPYMVGAGGTRLSVNANGTYHSETTWNFNNTIPGGAGGGGISSLWPIPSWQNGMATPASGGSNIMRNVPDVALNSDPYTGYSIYFQGGWHIFGGTSCASPLWAAFTARVNQLRAANGIPPLGFASPRIYQIAGGPGYWTDFHDIADGSTNLYYPAITGYDAATGWGSFNGANLLAELSATNDPGNTLYGQDAGSHITGTSNSMFGFDAGHANTAGSYNSFFGYNAGFSNTTSGMNSFFGFEAGSANIAGGSNSFFGSRAGSSNNTGNYNSFVGSYAGYLNTTGSFNSFLGQLSGGANTTGSWNTFAGEEAGAYNTTGSYNSMLGRQAGFYNTAGSSNAFFGHYAGHSNTTENNNSFLGVNSDGAAGITNATAIGYRAKVTQSNSLVLGSINGINGATADTNVGIGTTRPDTRLEVIGAIRSYTANENAANFTLKNDGAPSSWQLSTYNAGDLRITEAGIGPRVVIRPTSGMVGIGTTDPQYKLHVVGNIYASGSYLGSDARLKKNISDLRYGLHEMLQLHPVSFLWKDQSDDKLNLGLIAQEVERVIPELVDHAKNEAGMMSLNYIGLLPVLIKSIQEQDAKLDQKNAEIAALRSQNAALDARLTTLEQLIERLMKQEAKQEK